jgi:hypothetical protein
MSARSRLWLDLAMFAALLVAFNPAWTGLALHEWLSLAVAIPLLVHVIVNWEATLRVLEKFVDRLRHASAANLVVDSVLFVSTVGVVLSGVMVSRSIAGLLGLTTTPNALWVALHSFTADATIALLIVHFALHWRWLASVAFRLVPAEKPAPARVRAASRMPAPPRVTAAAAPAPVTRAPASQPVRPRY